MATLAVDGKMIKQPDRGAVDFVRKAFESFDADKSGFIDPHELRAALVMLGISPKLDALAELGLAAGDVEDKDGDGVLSLADLDKNNDNKIDFEEFKCLAAILPKRDHVIYRNSLSRDPITLPRDPTKVTAVMQTKIDGQEKTKAALNKALKRIKDKMKLDDKKIMKDTILLRKFQELDHTGDGRVDQKELEAYLQHETPELTTYDAWLIMNCGDTNRDKHITFDEFKRMMQTVALGV